LRYWSGRPQFAADVLRESPRPVKDQDNRETKPSKQMFPMRSMLQPQATNALANRIIRTAAREDDN
jgi:hypothetical protein